MHVITCEQVSNGHPDKICDQIADAIVTDCLQNDPESRVAIECLIKSNKLVIAGELTSKHCPNYRKLVGDVFERIGEMRLGYDWEEIGIETYVERQSMDIAMGVDKGGAGDQGMMYGYATNETPEMLPIPYVLAREFLLLLKDHPYTGFKADAKAQVSFDYDNWRITTFLCSVQHSAVVDVKDIKPAIEAMMHVVATRYGLNTDFDVLVNPTGRFTVGGPFADCGVTGRKLACDTYGGVGRIGGGALSGKDPSKVDRSGAYIARKIAKDVIRKGMADMCDVQIAYAIGVAKPVSVYVDCLGTEQYDISAINDYVSTAYDLTPNGIIDGLGLKAVDYNLVSAYGHFGRLQMPWEA
jgi:S-adenosylmethionine synthetase